MADANNRAYFPNESGRFDLSDVGTVFTVEGPTVSQVPKESANSVNKDSHNIQIVLEKKYNVDCITMSISIKWSNC